MDQIQDDCIDPSTTIIVTAAIITIVNFTFREKNWHSSTYRTPDTRALTNLFSRLVRKWPREAIFTYFALAVACDVVLGYALFQLSRWVDLRESITSRSPTVELSSNAHETILASNQRLGY
jgi:hypothetical protein